MKEVAVYPENIEDCYKVIDHVSIERDHYKVLYEQLQRHRYGQRSEKLSKDQLALFSELLGEDAEKEPQEETVTVPSHQRVRPKRKPLPEHLPRERVEHDLADEEKICACGCTLQRIGEEITEKLEAIPTQFKVIQHVRFKYGCKACETGVKIPSLPPMLIPKSIVTPSLLAMIVSDKFESHLPLHRQTQRFEALGIDLPRNTMANWVIVIGMFCESLLELMKQDMLQAKLIHADESPLRVLSEGKQKSYLWYYYGRVAESQICCIDFQASRHSIHPANFLKDYSDYMMTDAYSGYGELVRKKDVIPTYCWAHARRKFEAIPQPKKAVKKSHWRWKCLTLLAPCIK
ncbi:IS66 family transposase [Piscirickettsia litoralis]|uniref:IS66 family transposase n=1 Tax=Piscirickettsia litoralis TaxID=1891921 RepID=UPI000981BB23|nr:IS66 family transposase [Piscirickettsia litoralis]